MSPIRMSKIESSTRVALEFAEAFNRRDVESLLRMLSEDCIFEDSEPAPDGEKYSGKQAVAQFLQEAFNKRPYCVVVEDAFGMGLYCIMRWRREWTDKSGDGRRLRGVDIYKVEEGFIREWLSYVKGE